jgi:nucleoid-associated protein
MIIVEATIHQLIKDAQTSGSGSVSTHPRSSALPIDTVLTTLCTQLVALYAKTVNSYGTLGTDTLLHAFPVRLNQYFDRHADFQTFTTDTLNLIANKMEGALLSNGGYALFLRYEQGNEDFVLVAMLKLKPGAGIEEATLNLQPTLTIDLTLLHEAARINLTKWRSAAEPYLSFIKGSAKNGEVTNYFREALGCQNFTNSSHHTAQLIKAADDFVIARQDLGSAEEKQSEKLLMRKRLHDCFVANREEVVMGTLAAAIMPSAPDDFINFLRNGPQAAQYQINDSFKPDRKTYIRIRRISGTIGSSITVGFDVSDVEAGRVYYDAGSDGIVLKSPPEAIKKAILENATNYPS